MARRIALAGLMTVLLVSFLPSLTAAQDINFSVIPAVVRINNLPPGETTEFQLTIHNKDEAAHDFVLTAVPPPEEEREEGRAEFPDPSWIGFSSPEMRIAPNSTANVTVMVAIPQEARWTGQDWEIWLGVAAESADLLGMKLFVRLLVSTDSAAKARFSAGLFSGIAVLVVLLAYAGYYYFRHKAKPQ
jgi:hypothetical protein